jgi:hypothetical protein
MGESYTDRARGAEALARKARTPRERLAFEEIALIWRRLAAGQRVDTSAENRSFGPQ